MKRYLIKLARGVWLNLPRRWRLWAIRLSNPRFAVTVGAVVLDAQGRVLLLKHTFRHGTQWGIPGGFIKRREHPEDALRRELREEVRLEIKDVRLAYTRTSPIINHVEIMFLACADAQPQPASIEIADAVWVARDKLNLYIGASAIHAIETVITGRE